MKRSHENVTANGNPTFSIHDLKGELCLALSPESWAWSQQGSDVLFTYFDRLDFSVQNQSISNKIIDFKDTIKSTADILSYMNTVKNLSVCRGTDIGNEKCNPECMGILNDTESYKHTVQRLWCIRCRRLRKKLLQIEKKIVLQKKYEESKYTLHSCSDESISVRNGRLR
ncbi:uncharacterized protein [Neodiprion pinetum]|uniref:uncharacterized protein isoform X1 n=1 Tax=Neodiprion pinetum TaxID=441929 RepID=UPI00371B8B32